ncbi:MAG: hypothetical protein DRO99_05410, partial [Candidatus Aenigmatarchaeota archaeon]
MIPRRSTTTYRGMFRDILEAVFSGKLASGDNVPRFENEFGRYIGVEYALATSSGRDGLMMILRNYGLSEGDEIIVPSYTLEDIVKLMREAGYVPVFADVGKDYNMTLSGIRKAASGRTKAILATHLFGFPCEIESIVKFARKRGIVVIEDCAHSLGAECNGRKVGSFGDAAFFSFETRKIINALG